MPMRKSASLMQGKQVTANCPVTETKIMDGGGSGTKPIKGGKRKGAK